MSTPDNPVWMRVSAAALELKVDSAQVYRLAQRGKLETLLSAEGKWQVSRASVERMKREREAAAPIVA